MSADVQSVCRIKIPSISGIISLLLNFCHNTSSFSFRFVFQKAGGIDFSLSVWQSQERFLYIQNDNLL